MSAVRRVTVFLCTLLTTGCTGILGDAKREPSLATHALQAQPRERRQASAAARPQSGPRVVCDRVIDDFTRSVPGAFPAGWETHPAGAIDDAKREGAYVVELESGRPVLRARSRKQSFTIGRGVHDWNFREYPIVAWRWKALTLPAGAKETDRDDTVASVSAVWLIGLPFVVRTLRYSWSTSLPVGARASNRLGHDQLVVLESGPGRRGEWQEVQVNVFEHYQKLFERDDAEPPTGIALVTDADDTESKAEALYADFRLCRIEDSTTRNTQAAR